MHASREPPGQSDGVGDGVGEGEEPGVVVVVVNGGRQSVHHSPSHCLHCSSFPAQYSVVSPQYLPSHEQQPAEGGGDGDGDGEGAGVPPVEPISPNLMLENWTNASGFDFSKSAGT